MRLVAYNEIYTVKYLCQANKTNKYERWLFPKNLIKLFKMHDLFNPYSIHNACFFRRPLQPIFLAPTDIEGSLLQ